MANVSAGRIVLPDLVQSITFNISGEEKLKTIGRALNDISSGTKAHEYISDQETMIRRLIQSYEDYNNIQSKANAGELIKSFNALKAFSDSIDLSKVISEFELVDAAYRKASEDFGKDFSGFSADRFRDIAEAMSELAHYGVDVDKVFERLGQSSSVGKLHEQIRDLGLEVGRLKRELRNAEQERDNLMNGAEIQRLQEVEGKFKSLTETMAGEFRSFLHANDLESGDDYWNRFYDYFESIKNGSMTAKEAITNVRTELADLLQTAQPGDTVFSSTQMDEFINKLEVACRSIELMRSEIEELNNRAAMRGVAKEMSESADLTDRQREAIRGLIQESSGFNDVSQILVALVENFDTTDVKIQESVNAFRSLLTILDSIAHVEPAHMSGFNDVLKNLRMISELKVNSKKMASLEAALSSLSKIPNLSNLSLLGGVDLRGFNDIRVSKASMSNLAIYLPELSQNVNIEKLRALSQINLANFSKENLSVSNAAFKHLQELIQQIQGTANTQIAGPNVSGMDSAAQAIDQVTQKVKQESAVLREGVQAKEADAAAAEAAAKAEDDKRKISELLADALKREEAAAKMAGESTERDATKTKKAVQVTGEATVSMSKLSAILDKISFGKFSAELIKVQEQFSALQEKPAHLAENMKLLEKAERDMREATSVAGQLEAFNRFALMLDVVRSQIGAVNAEVKNSGSDFNNMLNMVKQANSAMEGIGNSSFTNKLREMSAKTKEVADESVIRNLTRMRQAYIDMQSAYGTAGPASATDYEALINAYIRWQEALKGVNQALAANRAETIANKESSIDAIRAQEDAMWAAYRADADAEAKKQAQIADGIAKHNAAEDAKLIKTEARIEATTKREIESNDKAMLAEEQRMRRLAAEEAEYYAKQERIAAEAEAKKQAQIAEGVRKHQEALAKEEAAIEAATRKEIAAWEKAEEAKIAANEKAISGAAYDQVITKLKELGNARKQLAKYSTDTNDPMFKVWDEEVNKLRKDYNELIRTLNTKLNSDQRTGIVAELRKQQEEINRIRNVASGKDAQKGYTSENKTFDGAAEQVDKLLSKYDALKNKEGEAKASVEALKTAYDALRNTTPGTAERTEAVKTYKDALDRATEAVKTQAKAEKDAETNENNRLKYLKQANNLYSQCEDALKKYAASAKDASTKETYESIRKMRDELDELRKRLTPTGANIDGVGDALKRMSAEFNTAKTNLSSWGTQLTHWVNNGLDQLKSRLTYTFGLATMVYKAVNEIKQMISTAVELDAAMNELQIVTRASGAEMGEYSKRVSNMAQETAQATKDLISATTVYARLGYSMDESSTLAKFTAMLQGVGDIDASAAQDAITAIVKAFDIGVNDIETAMDKMVVVGNNFPISVSQIAEGMNNAGSMLAVAGNSFEESIALLTAANTTIQNISKASTGLRTIAARIRKTTTGEDGDEIVEESKYNDMINALTKHKVTITDINGEYRST